MGVTNEKLRKHKIFRELEGLISEMNYNVDATVVEGPHDKKTLKLLGYKKPILICSKLSQNELADLVTRKSSNMVILTDFDEQGILLHDRLFKFFEERGVKTGGSYRREFQKLLEEAGISTIEGIYSIKLELFG